ncbi:hypothetical protein RB653_006279 [Dictyostelium firmibasis]|uniref:Ubiquitin carboxyl-terminal hydrolase n=1 Tax=Dictyostelium firmibasis TaxID=79012 RepID=A0AAN7U8P1_9MYCE
MSVDQRLIESQKNWIPLEANPKVLTKFMQGLGVSKDWKFCDIYGIDDGLLEMIPSPCIAVILLFPITPEYEDKRINLEKELKEKGQILSDKVYFMKQYIGNACGTIGVIHSVLNNANVMEFNENGFFRQFLDQTTSLSTEERAISLMKNGEIEKSHEISALQGQSNVPHEDESVILHFVSFVHVDGHLYELDGRNSFAINHGKSSPETLLKDTAKVLQMMIDENPAEIRFNLMGLVKKQEGDEDDEEEQEEEEKPEEKK